MEVVSSTRSSPYTGEKVTDKFAQRDSKREITRSKIAYSFVIGFLIITASPLVAGWIRGDQVKDIKDLMLTISGILSAPLGFIIGFYFKAGNKE